MDRLLSKIYWSIKGHKRFHIVALTGIYAEVIVSNKIYLNWRIFGKKSSKDHTFYCNKNKNIILVNNLTLEKIESKIFFTQSFDHYTYLLESENFLTYFLKRSISSNIKIYIFS
jgi:hypothetical protein